MVEPLRHRQTKEADNRYVRPTATAPHLDFTQSLPSHDGLKSCDVRCWSDSCQKIAGPRMQRSVFAAAKQPRHSIKSPTQTDTSHSRNGKLWNVPLSVPVTQA